MAFAFEKPLRDFLQNFQKDMNALQKKIKQESDELVHKAKAAATKDNIHARRKEIEDLVDQKLKQFEPSINKFVHELSTTAQKAGVDLTELEKRVRGKLASRTTGGKSTEGAKSRSKKVGATKARKAPTKKAAAKRSSAKAAAPAAAASTPLETADANHQAQPEAQQ